MFRAITSACMLQSSGLVVVHEYHLQKQVKGIRRECLGLVDLSVYYSPGVSPGEIPGVIQLCVSQGDVHESGSCA